MRIPFLNSLYGRIFAIFWLTLLLVLMAVLVAQHYDPRNQHDLTGELRAKYQGLADRISTRFERQPGAMQQDILRLMREEEDKAPVRLYFTTTSGDQIPLFKHHHSRSLRNFITIADDPEKPIQRLYGRWMMAGPFVVSDGNERAWMYIGRIWRPAPPFIIQILDRPLQLLLVTMVVSTPFLLWLAWAVTKPARRMQGAAERVAKGQFDADPDLERGPSEFKQAGASFNQMVLALNQIVAGQQRLLSDISHELRSPLTRLRMANALAQRKQGGSKELTRIDTEAERLEIMIADLLALSRMQADSHAGRDRLTAKEIWQEMLADARFEAEQCGKLLVAEEIPDCTLNVNLNLIRSALENVIRNAIKYAHHKTNVVFVLADNELAISVTDDGDGVPDAELCEIFRPFYRVSEARDRESGGTGLGLAITESALRQHGGRAAASGNAQGGLTVTLTLPVSP